MKLVELETYDGGTLRMWDIKKKVGKFSPNVRMDVKFCQFMFYKVSKRLLLSDVDGIWGPKSAAALAGWEKGAKLLVRDEIIDVIPPGGNGVGTISKKVYKLVTLQCYYICDTLGISDLGVAFSSASAVQTALLAMPEDCDDMPADLRHDMVAARDGIFAS